MLHKFCFSFVPFTLYVQHGSPSPEAAPRLAAGVGGASCPTAGSCQAYICPRTLTVFLGLLAAKSPLTSIKGDINLKQCQEAKL